LVANALSGGKPAHNKTGKTMAPPAPAIELIKPAIKATPINPIKSVSDKSIFLSGKIGAKKCEQNSPVF
jgi:hypothetical protein